MDEKLLSDWKDKIINAILDAANPVRCVENLFLDKNMQDISIQALKKKGYKRFHVISIGKASVTMAKGLINQYENYISGGVIVHKSDYIFTPDKWHEPFMIIGASHPIPDERSVIAAREVSNYLSTLNESDFVYFLISGGGSALLTIPENDISITDMMKMNKLLLECGAKINEINCIRKHIDGVKGGKLIAHTAPAGFCTLILSDVLGDPIDVIASGPTVPDQSTFSEALTVIEKYHLGQEVPNSIFGFLSEGEKGFHPETIKENKIPENFFAPMIIGGNRNSLDAARNCASALGMKSIILSDHLIGEARNAADWIISEAKKVLKNDKSKSKTWCFLCGGETTVTIHGKGLGGRNLELALSAVRNVAEIENAFFTAFATDGEDGPTDAAGAWVTTATHQIAKENGLSVDSYLENNDSYHFFEKIGQLIKTGSSGTNVNDICFLIIEN